MGEDKKARLWDNDSTEWNLYLQPAKIIQMLPRF